MDSTELIRHTLSDTLPHLFINRNDRVLEAIGFDLEEKVSTLLMEHSYEILAQTFLLHSRTETEQVLAFIVKVLIDDTEGNNEIEVKNLVQTCYIPLLAELVIVMGEEGSSRIENVGHSSISLYWPNWEIGYRRYQTSTEDNGTLKEDSAVFSRTSSKGLPLSQHVGRHDSTE